MRIILFLAILPDIIRGECKDTDNGAKDYKNEGCDWYTKSTMPDTDDPNKAWCGAYDDDDFKAHKMCCACKDSIYETVRVNVWCSSNDEKVLNYLGKPPSLAGCAEYCQYCKVKNVAEGCEEECHYFLYDKSSNGARECFSMKTADCPEGWINDDDTSLFKMKKNIVDEAKTNADLSKFVGAIEKAGLDEELQGDGPFTVFAPINAAFEARTDELTNLNEKDQKKILLRHVVREKLMPYDIPRGITTKQTAGDEKIDVIKAIFPAKNQDTIVIKSSAGNGIVINQPIDALNGVIHIVNEIF